MKPTIRPTGIIRTLPSIYNGTDKPDKKPSVGFIRYQRSLEELERGRIPAIYIALQCIPKIEVGENIDFCTAHWNLYEKTGRKLAL